MINYLTKKAVKFSTPKKIVTPEIIIEKVNNEVGTVSYELDAIITELKRYGGLQVEQLKKTVTDEIESLEFMKRVNDCKIKISTYKPTMLGSTMSLFQKEDSVRNPTAESTMFQRAKNRTKRFELWRGGRKAKKSKTRKQKK